LKLLKNVRKLKLEIPHMYVVYLVKNIEPLGSVMTRIFTIVVKMFGPCYLTFAKYV
jgi:hypothetical protein